MTRTRDYASGTVSTRERRLGVPATEHSDRGRDAGSESRRRITLTLAATPNPGASHRVRPPPGPPPPRNGLQAQARGRPGRRSNLKDPSLAYSVGGTVSDGLRGRGSGCQWLPGPGASPAPDS